MLDRYVISALIAFGTVLFFYTLRFYFQLDYVVSDDSAVWGQLGDYLGGTLNPIFSFISIVLLIKSLSLQNQANASLREDLKNSRKTEKLRSFEALFFNLIESQRRLFETLNIQSESSPESNRLKGVSAALEIEARVERARDQAASHEQIRDLIEGFDETDQIFGICRAFYIAVKLTKERLSEVEGFQAEDRKYHFTTLINLTEFSQLRLIVICQEFMNYQSVKYLNDCEEYGAVLNELGICKNVYVNAD